MNRLTKYRADIQAYDYIELCGGISEAVTNKLGKLEDLEQELGCPLDTFKIMNQGYVYTDTFNNQLKKFKFDKVFKHTNINNEYILCFLFREIEDEDNNTLGINWIVGVNEYKKSFWLREDKSE